MKIIYSTLILFLFSCSENIEKQILENNKNADFKIYEQIVNDSTLFFFFPEDKFSDIKFIINKTKKWKPERFYISSKNTLGEFLRGEDELSDKNTIYLFSEVEDLVSESEKEALAKFSQTIIIDTIDYEFNNLKKISSNEAFEGMCIEISKPVFSSNNELAFLDVYLHKNLTKTRIDTSTYYEKIGIILKKDNNNNWKLFKKKLWLML
jgi:hypothetical protein